MDKLPHQLIDGIVSFLAGLTPGALGASVSLAYEKGLTWTDRFIQLGVGIVVSYFAGGVIAACWRWGTIDPFVLQGIKFTIGMIAFKATPRFASNCADAVVDVPGALRDRIPFLKRKEGGE